MEKPKSPKQALYDFVINNSDLELLDYSGQTVPPIPGQSVPPFLG